LGGPKQKALLARLLLDLGRPVAIERLIDDLWGERVPESAAKMVQVYVSQLRKVLPEGMLVTRPPGYLVAADPENVDLYRFERLVDQGRAAVERGDPAGGAELLRQALALWRGAACGEFREPFAVREAARLKEMRLACLEDRIEADLAGGRHGGLAGELEALVARHPLRERLRSQLMLCLYRSGRQADALEAYRAYRLTLDEELGIAPSARLQELEMLMLRQAPELEAPPLPAERRPTNRRRARPGSEVLLFG